MSGDEQRRGSPRAASQTAALRKGSERCLQHYLPQVLEQLNVSISIPVPEAGRGLGAHLPFRSPGSAHLSSCLGAACSPSPLFLSAQSGGLLADPALWRK